MAELRNLAGRLPAPTKVIEAAGIMTNAVQQCQPLLAMGLGPEHGLPDHLLVNQLLPVLRATHLPLLLVPEAAPAGLAVATARPRLAEHGLNVVAGG